jgi:pimeloyl-ACP methyl ester carboxylesterase
MPFVTLKDNSRMYYVEQGKGPAVVFVHGWIASSWVFEAQVKYFGSHGYRAIAFDLKGCGQSDKPKTAHYRLQENAQEIDYALSQIIGSDKAVLVGHSMGAMIVLCSVTDARLAKRLNGVVVAEGAAKLQNPMLDQYVEALRSGTIKIGDRATIESTLVNLCFGQEYQKANPKVIKQAVDMWLQAESHVALASMEAIMKYYDVTSMLKNIKTPTLIIHAESDTFIPVASGQALAKAIPNAELVLLKPPTAHLAQIENPAAFNAAVEKFLRRVAAKPA